MTSPALTAASVLAALLIGAPVMQAAHAQSTDLGGGFMDHGPAGSANENRGMACTLDGDGREVVLMWLFDSRYSYALAVIDAQTGEVEEVPRPIDHDCPFSSMLSSRGRFYTYFGGHFMEFDPLQREFTFVQESLPRMAMSMTEDDDGVIWTATNPNCTVVSYNPETGEFRDYGSINRENWDQFPGSIAVDDTGWVYVGNGPGAEQIIIMNPETGESAGVLADDERDRGPARVWRHEDGKVYGLTRSGQWYELHGGQAVKRDTPPDAPRRRYISESFILRHSDLPGGERIKEVDLWDNRASRLVIEDPRTGQERELTFQVSGGGGHPMSLATAPNGTIIGATYIPQQVFSYDPRTDELTRYPPFTQWNAMDVSPDGLLYVGGYGYGVILEWDPAREWVDTDRENPDSNPRYLVNTIDLQSRHINRPADILAHPGGRLVILAGIPYRGDTGGGLTIWDRETETAQVLTDQDLIPDQSTTTMLALPGGKLLCGTTTTPSMGGERKAPMAELYILDLEALEVEWRAPLLTGAVRYNDMIAGPDGKVFGMADRKRFFVFDPHTRSIVHSEYLDEEQFGATVGQQAERVFVRTSDGRIFLLFNKGIAQLDPETYEITMVAEAPSRIGTGGGYLDGRIYFGSGTNVHSWQPPPQP